MDSCPASAISLGHFLNIGPDLKYGAPGPELNSPAVGFEAMLLRVPFEWIFLLSVPPMTVFAHDRDMVVVFVHCCRSENLSEYVYDDNTYFIKPSFEGLVLP